MLNPYRFHPDASAAVKSVQRECSGCGRLFEPLAAADWLCDGCWNEQDQDEEEESDD